MIIGGPQMKARTVAWLMGVFVSGVIAHAPLADAQLPAETARLTREFTDRRLPLPTRRAAARTSAISALDLSSVPALTAVLKDHDEAEELRDEVVLALEDLLRETFLHDRTSVTHWFFDDTVDSPESVQANLVAPLVAVLKDTSEPPLLRCHIARVLANLGRELSGRGGHGAVWSGQLQDLLEDKNVSVRREVARATRELTWQARAESKTLKAVAEGRESNPVVRRYVVEALQNSADEASATSIAILRNRAEDVFMRRLAASALAKPFNRYRRPGSSPSTLLDFEGLRALMAALKHPGEDIQVLLEIFALFDDGESMTRIASDPDIVTALRRLLTDRRDSRIRRAAAKALAATGARAHTAIPELVQALGSDDASVVREEAASALHSVAEEAPEAVVPELVAALRDEVPAVRRAAARSLFEIGARVGAATDRLVTALRTDSDDSVRKLAARTLERVTDVGASGVHALADVLNGDASVEVRDSAATALGSVKPVLSSTVAALVMAMKDGAPIVSRAAASSLAKFHPDGLEALIAATRAGERNSVRASAVSALGTIHALGEAIPVYQALLRPEEDDEVLEATISSTAHLGALATPLLPALTSLAARARDKRTVHRVADAVQHIAHESLVAKDYGALEELESASAALKKRGLEMAPSDRRAMEPRVGAIEEDISLLSELKRGHLLGAAWQRFSSHAWVLGPLLYLPILVLVYALRPIWLFTANEFLKRHELSISLQRVKERITLRKLLVVGYFHYSDRVLDAWVARHADIARAAFEKLPTVRAHRVRVPTEVGIDGKTWPDLTAERLRAPFAQKHCIALIVGEGGSGKTSLAIRMAHMAIARERSDRLAEERLMLPVLLENDVQPLPAEADGGGDEEVKGLGRRDRALLAAIRGQVQPLVGADYPLSDELIWHLLHKRRILVIVDRFSELDDFTRELVRPARATFPVRSLVVTSRASQPFEGQSVVVEPRRLHDHGVSAFITGYAGHRGKEDWLPRGAAFFEACRQIVSMNSESGVRGGTPVLLAKMFADYLIASVEGGEVSAASPQNVPELMLVYMNVLNRGVLATARLDNGSVQKAAKVAAWQCIKRTFRPAKGSREEIISALESAMSHDRRQAVATLDYLEHRLRVVRSSDTAPDNIEFTLDPLAEYLGGLWFLEDAGDDANKWRALLKDIRPKAGSFKNVRGALQAFADCCEASVAGVMVPPFVRQRLRQMLDSATAARETQLAEEGPVRPVAVQP